MSSKRFQNKALHSFWSVHIEAWRRSGLSQRAYCIRHRLSRNTFTRWLKHLVGKEDARKHAEYLRELRRDERQEQREKWRKRPLRHRYGARTDKRSPAVQAFWAMHVEAMNWSGMGIHEYASALRLSPTSLRKWRNRLEDGEVVIDWRAVLHPSARALLRTSSKDGAVDSSLTMRSEAVPARPGKPRRRRYSAEEKLALVLESERPEETVSSAARRHGITAAMLFRWRAELGFGKDKRAALATVALADGEAKASAALAALHDLVRPPDGMMVIELDDGRRVFAPEGSDPNEVKRHVAERETQP